MSHLDLLLKSLTMLARGARTQPATKATQGWRYRSFAELVLAEGRVFLPATDTGLVPFDWRGAPSTCFVTASLWAVDADLIYVEGWAATGVLHFGTEHAWCAAPNDAVALDPTWDEPGDAYIGIPFDPNWRRRYATPSLLTPLHDVGRSLLRSGLPDDARTQAGMPISIAGLEGV